MYIPGLKYHRPRTLNGVYHVLKTNDKTALLAGGTDLLVELKQGIRSFDSLISLKNITSLTKITENNDEVIIGSCATHNQIADSEIVRNYIPALADTCLTIGTHQIRNTATIGGNLCTCASCADSAPILIIYNATLEIGSESGNRLIPAYEFFLGHHVNALQKGELLLNIIIPKHNKDFGAYFEKFGLRESASISVASVAAGFRIENNKIINANIVIGACAPTPIISEKAISLLNNSNIEELFKDSELLGKIGEAAASEIHPIDDIRASAAYRKEIVNVITQRVILKAISKVNK